MLKVLGKDVGRCCAGFSSHAVFVYQDDYTSQLIWVVRCWRCSDDESVQAWTEPDDTAAVQTDSLTHCGILLHDVPAQHCICDVVHTIVPCSDDITAKFLCVCARARARVRACVHACVCVRACVRVCVCAWMRADEASLLRHRVETADDCVPALAE